MEALFCNVIVDRAIIQTWQRTTGILSLLQADSHVPSTRKRQHTLRAMRRAQHEMHKLAGCQGTGIFTRNTGVPTTTQSFFSELDDLRAESQMMISGERVVRRSRQTFRPLARPGDDRI